MLFLSFRLLVCLICANFQFSRFSLYVGVAVLILPQDFA